MIRRSIRAAILFGAVVATNVSATSIPALGQSCQFTVVGVNFGSVDPATGQAYDATGAFTADCTGLPGATVRVCPNFGDGSGGAGALETPRYLIQGADRLSYNLFQDANHATVWGAFPLTSPPTVNVALDASGKGTANRTVYGHVFGGQFGVASGGYSSSFAGTETAITYEYASLLGCASILTAHLSRAPFVVQAIVPQSCVVAAASLDFGTVGLLSGSIQGTGAITATCTSGTPYQISLDGGLSGAADPTQRKLSNGAKSVTYGLYRDAARTQPWGATLGANTHAGLGSGGAQSVTIYGAVPAQTSPGAGVYTDTIVVTLTY